MKAQVSIEFFFAAVMAFLAFYWLLNFLNQARASGADISVMQEQLIANEMASAVNQVCISNSSLTLRLPCVVSVNQSLFYSINASGNNLTVLSPNVPGNWTASTLCPVVVNFTNPATGNLIYVACNIQNRSFSQRACVSKDLAAVRISFGICNQ